MSYLPESQPPSDVCLLLRAHAEQRWLSREVIPVLRQVENPDSLPEEQHGAALAYLEVIWIEAQQRAQETENSHATLREHHSVSSVLPEKAYRYHGAVRQLREVVSRRVARLLSNQNVVTTRMPVQS
jgi:hypothetical protein